MDRDNIGLKTQVKTLRASVQEVNSEREFFKEKAKDIKRKN